MYLREVSKLGDRVRLRFRVDGAGAVVLRGKAFVDGKRRRICGDRARLQAQDAVALICRLSPRAARRLAQRALPITLRATYTPDAGTPTVLSHLLRLP